MSKIAIAKINSLSFVSFAHKLFLFCVSITLAKRSGIVIISLQTHFFSKFINNKEKSALIIKIIKMKKLLIASGVAVLAFAMVAGAQGYTFSSNLTVGSTGADVVALQTALMAAGHNIPAVASGAAAKGYFGSQTKTAVQAYQASKSIPTTGFVGPMTRAALNGGALTVSNCLSGWTSVSYQGAQVCLPPGYTLPGSTPVGTSPTPAPGVVSTPGVAGTIDITLRSTPSDGTDVKKGEEMVVATYELQSSDSDMALSNIALKFNKRLWLYAGSITILDGSNVIASKSGLTEADFTEVTSGTDYRVRFNGLNYVVPRNSKKVITVRVKMLGFTDRTAETISLTEAEVRAVDGTGVSNTDTITSTRTFDFVASNTANIVVTLNPLSPLKKVVQTSTSGETKDVLLGVYDLKSENRPSTLKTLKVGLNTSAGSLTTIFSDIKIDAGNGLVYSADSVAATSTFSTLSIPLPQDQRVSVRVLGTVADADNFTDGISASSTVWGVAISGSVGSVTAEDANFDTATVSGGKVVSSDAIFMQSGAQISGGTFFINEPGTNSSGRLSDTLFGGTFTVSAGDKTSLYISRTPATAFATSTNSTLAAASSTMTSFVPSGDTLPQDTSTFYVIPAGSSRAFTIGGSLNNKNGTLTTKTTGVTTVYFTDDTGSAQKFNINFGLEGLNSNFAKGVLLGNQ